MVGSGCLFTLQKLYSRISSCSSVGVTDFSVAISPGWWGQAHPHAAPLRPPAAFPGTEGREGPGRGRRGGQAGPGPRFEAMVEPPNFSWVAEGRLAGLGMPREPGHYRFLLGRGVKHLVSLSERPPPHHGCCPAVQLHRFRVPDFTPPTARQIQSFLQLVEEANGRGEAVAVHCMLGHGRTGTMLACYLVKTQKMSGSDAIREIRRLRPGSIETREQEQAVMEFHRRFSAGEDSREA